VKPPISGRPELVVAPIPSPSAYGGRACYWTDFVVRADSPFQSLEQTFGHRLALTTPESQSGYAARLRALMAYSSDKPLYREIIEPRFTPMGAPTAVIDNKADVVPLDSYALALLAKYAHNLTGQVRVIKSTEPTAIPASGPAPAKVSQPSWRPTIPRDACGDGPTLASPLCPSRSDGL